MFMISDDLKEVRSYTLGVRLMEGKKTGSKINDQISSILEKFGLSDKKINAVTDAGGNVQLAAELAEMEQHLCLGHGLHNLIVVDGLQKSLLIRTLLTKVKSIVRAVRYRAADLEIEAKGEQRKKILAMIDVNDILDADEENPFPTNEEEALQEDDDGETPASETDQGNAASQTTPKFQAPKTVKNESATRWFSTLEMCASIDEENRTPVNTIMLRIGRDDLVLSASEWKLLRALVKFLELFRNIVTLMSAEKSCTINIALLMRSEIESCLINDDNDPLPIAEMKNFMKQKLDHRFPVTDLVVTAALLDPRFHSLNEVEAPLAKKDMSKAQFLVDQMSERLKESDVRLSTTASSTSASSSSGSSAVDLASLARKHSSIISQETRAKEAEAQTYLATSSVSSVQDGDVLAYWRERLAQYPSLCALVKAVLHIPCTSTPVERVFSIDGIIVNAKRSRLAPNTIDKVTFIHDNYETCKNAFTELD